MKNHQIYHHNNNFNYHHNYNNKNHHRLLSPQMSTGCCGKYNQHHCNRHRNGTNTLPSNSSLEFYRLSTCNNRFDYNSNLWNKLFKSNKKFINHKSWLILLLLLIILIWSIILSSIMIIHSYREKQISMNMIDIFTLHKNFGQLAFTIGNEMLSTIEQTNNQQLKQNETDIAIKQFIHSLKQYGFNDNYDDDDDDGIEQILNKKLNNLRLNCNRKNDDEIILLNKSLLINDCIKIYENFFKNLNLKTILLNLDENQSNNQFNYQQLYTKSAIIDLSIRMMPYTLFIRGVIYRYMALGYASILSTSTSSSISIINITDYLQYYYTSRKQIESSFIWNENYYKKYLEMEQTEYQQQMESFINNYNEHFNKIQWKFKQMNKLLTEIFTNETINHIDSYLKKKNAESIELIEVNGNRTKYINADQLANNNLFNIAIDLDFIENFNIKNLENLIHNNNIVKINNFYNKKQLQTNQIRFLLRIHDFLNNSMYAHLTQTMLMEQTDFIYHLIIITMLIISVISGILFYIYKSFTSSSKSYCHHQKLIKKPKMKKSLNRRLSSIFLRKRSRNHHKSNNISTPLLYRKYFTSPNITNQCCCCCKKFSINL